MLVVGDVHGKYNRYYELVKDAKSSFCLGDFGFQDTWYKLYYSDLDNNVHKVGQGNHDPHDKLTEPGSFGSFVGRFGNIVIPNSPEFFWIGGALSIDMVYRVVEWLSNNRKSSSKTWFPNEQLDYHEMELCLQEYLKRKPDILITHTCPDFLIPNITGGNKPGNIMDRFVWSYDYHDMTSQFIGKCIKEHRPKKCIFGHFHTSYHEVVDGVEYVGLAELETVEI